jgi:hypothetical protein
MRKLKFRFFVPKKNGYEIVNYGYIDGEGNPWMSSDIQFPEGTIISQWTGTYDKDGKKIYEDDIVGSIGGTKSSDIPHCVGMIVLTWAPLQIMMAEVLKKISVLGNIHQNPELLK